ncbi:MAG: N-acetylmuramoyl-L-alanine amidase-like domain-containing protein [Elusimicrobiota bacterium]
MPTPRLALLALSLLAAAPARAEDPAAAQARIQGLIGSNVGRPAADRILGLGESLLEIPYIGSPLGDGPSGVYDRNPLSRFDGFDCTTFVETLAALALSDSADDFQTTLNRIRYKNGAVSFVNRNHFTDLDWIPNNVRAGFFRDVTESLAPGRTLVAGAEIDKRAWYAKMGPARIHVPGLAEDQKQNLLAALRAEGELFSPEEATIPYIPLTVLFGPDGGGVLDGIASGSIVNIVRPNWDLVKLIGTHLNVSHQGFAVRKDGVLYFLEASDALKKTAMVPMTDYLRPYLESPTIKGINVLEIVQRP